MYWYLKLTSKSSCSLTIIAITSCNRTLCVYWWRSSYRSRLKKVWISAAISQNSKGNWPIWARILLDNGHNYSLMPGAGFSELKCAKLAHQQCTRNGTEQLKHCTKPKLSYSDQHQPQATDVKGFSSRWKTSARWRARGVAESLPSHTHAEIRWFLDKKQKLLRETEPYNSLIAPINHV